jgi:hypothetical protein
MAPQTVPTTPSAEQSAAGEVAPGTHAAGTPAPPAVGAGPSGLAVAALVLGILALLVSAVPVVNLLALIGGIAAIALGVVAARRTGRGGPGRALAVVGAVLGGIAVTVAVLVLLVVGALFTTAGTTVDGELSDVIVELEAD